MKLRFCHAILLCLLGVSFHVSAQHAMTSQQCIALGESLVLDATRIGEPVAGAEITSVDWSDTGPAVHCRIEGRLMPVSTEATARDINFGIALPATWNGRTVQMGGGGINGVIPNLTGFGPQSELAQGYVTYGSDSGHSDQEDEWALNDEAIQNLSYMQMKKTHDATMQVIEQVYMQLPEYTYYVGNSMGGREALIVVQRYYDDYDGVLSTVPIVGLSSLMLGPTRMRIREKPLANWVSQAKAQTVLAEFMRQCDDLDGRVDGVINNYVDCRALFNVNDEHGPATPWANVLCPDDVDPAPENTGVDACLTTAQAETLHLLFSDIDAGIHLPNGRTDFGMWAPTTSLAGGSFFGGIFTDTRYRGQEGAADDAPVFTVLGTLGVTGFYMQDVDGDPLNFTLEEHGARQELIAPWMDATQPDLSDYADAGGKLIVIVGTNDIIASSGEQLNYYDTVLEAMGEDALASFARLYVLPQTGHGLTGSAATIDGDGNTTDSTPIPSSIDRFALLTRWVEEGVAPEINETVTGTAGSRPMCSYPGYPHYQEGDPALAGSYSCEMPAFH